MAAQLRGSQPEPEAVEGPAVEEHSEQAEQQTAEPEPQLAAEFAARLFRTKPQHQLLVDSIHRDEDL